MEGTVAQEEGRGVSSCADPTCLLSVPSAIEEAKRGAGESNAEEGCSWDAHPGGLEASSWPASTSHCKRNAAAGCDERVAHEEVGAIEESREQGCAKVGTPPHSCQVAMSGCASPSRTCRFQQDSGVVEDCCGSCS
mmetsp:Transcript_129302/g.335279  ORF Transcript_129302/g.335279 Transcript_129302/m.335279 type:complete len:136 (+) Transcript_129302:2344-2751(+)